MVRVDLKGVHSVRSKGRLYHYAWRGGPRLLGSPGSPEFLESYREAHECRQVPDVSRFRLVITSYKASKQYEGIAATTKATWSVWFDRIDEHFGDLHTAQFNRPEKIRPLIIRWRNQFEQTPDAADTGICVLSRILSHAVDPLCLIGTNPCARIKKLGGTNRADLVWSDADIARLKEHCSPELAHAIDLAVATGLRVSELIRVAWAHVLEDSIVISTGKSLHTRVEIIPLYGQLREILSRIPKVGPVILTNSRGIPWTRAGLSTALRKAKVEAGLHDKNHRFHDLRGTAATKFYLAGLSLRVIAEILAWEEDRVEKIIRRYVSRTAATQAIIRQLDGMKDERRL